MAPVVSYGHVTPTGQVRDPDFLHAIIFKMAEDRGSVPIGSSILLIEWSYDRWRHVTM